MVDGSRNRRRRESLGERMEEEELCHWEGEPGLGDRVDGRGDLRVNLRVRNSCLWWGEADNRNAVKRVRRDGKPEISKWPKRSSSDVFD